MSALAWGGLALLVCVILLVIGLMTAPEGEEIPGVGFVEKKK